MHISVQIDLYEEKLDDFQNNLQENPLVFIKNNLPLLYKDFRFDGGNSKLLEEELEDLQEDTYPLEMDSWAIIEAWVEDYFKEMDLVTANAVRDLLAMLYTHLEESEMLECMAERFQREPKSLLLEADSSALMNWLLIWMRPYFPQLLLLLFGKSKYNKFSCLETVDLALAIQYLPKFILWNFGDAVEDHRRRQIIPELANGKNILKIDAFKFSFTKKMAHFFYNAPREYTFSKSIWYGIVAGTQGDVRLVDYLYQYYQERQPNLDFLQRVIRFFSKKGHFLDYYEFRPLLGYLQHLLDESPNFSMKGWTLASLRRRYQEYHRGRYPHYYQMMEGQKKVFPSTWEGANYPGFYKKQEDTIYEIVQLTSSAELLEEGKALRHCVRGYVMNCLKGYCTIWSLQKKLGDGKAKKFITIEVNNRSEIVQARGKFNAQPKKEYMLLIEQWAIQANLGINLKML